MSKPIQTRIVKIDNSQGIHIPKSWLGQIGISGTVEIEVHGDRLVIRAAQKPGAGWFVISGALKPRADWEEAFAKMAEQHDDVLLDDVTTTEWKEFEWEW
ncbi:AbrB/MazE/SpoVT family DNA-binding domain-containing protein [Microcoleus sp. AT3-D2]|uniref:AbrB/MazE/SpoVT family DNA-binding domain-containing protein n=1 Tax=Microcoleus sp. AT3-D2 TaxID=2818612 RepID=UPI002FD7723A